MMKQAKACFQKMENFKNMLGELKTLIEAEATKRMQEKAQRKEENRAQLEAIKNEITVRKTWSEITSKLSQLRQRRMKSTKKRRNYGKNMPNIARTKMI